MSRRIEPHKKKAEELMSRAGIIEPREKGAGTLATEAVLIFRGPWKSTLKIFDQDGAEIGSAHKARNRNVYELGDAERRCRICERKTSRKDSLRFVFSVLDRDGVEIGTIIDEKVPLRGLLKPRPQATIDELERMAARGALATLEGGDGQMVAGVGLGPRSEVIRRRLSPRDLVTRVHYGLDRLSCQRYVVEDEPGHEVARLTYVRPSFWRNHVSYVLEVEPDLAEPLRTLIVATPIVVDNKILSFNAWGEGGG